MADIELTTIAEFVAKAEKASPAFTGVPTAPTAAPGTNTTQIATTAFALAALSGKQNQSATLDLLAALSSTAYGRSLLEIANAAGIRVAAGLDTTANQTDSTGKRFLTEARSTMLGAIEQTKYLSGYASLAAAKTAIGTTPTHFKITSNHVTSGTDDTPANFFVEFEGEGKITTTNSTDVFTINKRMAYNGNVNQVFFGPGRVQYAKNATGGHFEGGEWLPAPTVAVPNPEITWKIIDGWRWSLFLNDGGYLYLPWGEYKTTIGGGVYFIPPNNSTIIGRGSGANGIGGQGTKIQVSDNDTEFIRVVAGSDNIELRSFGINMLTGSNKTGIHAKGQASDGNGCFNIRLRNMNFEGGRAGLRMEDVSATRGGWQMTGFSIDDSCTFIGQTVGCIENNSVNSGVSVRNSSFTPASNGTAHSYHMLSVGVIDDDGSNIHNGTNKAFPQTYLVDFVAGDVTLASSKVTKTGHNMDSIRPVYVTGVSGGVPPAPLDPNVRYLLRVDGNDLTFFRANDAANAIANTNKIVFTDVGSGSMRIWSSKPIASGWPDAVLFLDGPFVSASLKMAQCEGFPNAVKIGPNTPANPNQEVHIYGGITQGQIHVEADVSVHYWGGTLPPRHLTDIPGVSADFYIHGTTTQRYIDGVTYYAPGSLPLAVDRQLDNFIGPQTGVRGSQIIYGEQKGQGSVNREFAKFEMAQSVDDFFGTTKPVTTVRRPNFNSKLLSMSSGTPDLSVGPDYYPQESWFEKKSTGSTPYMLTLRSNREGIEDDLTGLAVVGAVVAEGRTANKLWTSVTSGTSIGLDAKLGSQRHLTLAHNATITITNTANILEGQDLYLRVTGNGSPFTITFGTGFDAIGNFSTVASEVTTLHFKAKGAAFEEVGRAPGAGGGSVATDAIFDAKGDMAIGTGADTAVKLTVGANDTFHVADSAAATGTKWTDTIKQLLIRGAAGVLKFYDRAGDATSMQVYSPTSGKLAIYRDLSGGDVFTIDGAEAIFSVPAKAGTDNAYDATGWNGSLRYSTENAVRDKIESLTAGSGDVVGPGTATDNALVRFDTTTGKLIQNSSVTLSDANGGFTSADYMSFANGGGGYNTGFYHSTNLVAYVRNTRFEPLALALSTETPAQITANQNDYSLAYQYVVHRLSTDASRNITGMVQNVNAGNGGDYKLLINVGSFDIVLKHQDAASAAANRFLNSTGADITLTPNQAAECHYDGTTSRWRVFKKN